MLDFEIPGNVLNSGVVTKSEFVLLFVTLEKQAMAAEHQYDDQFLSPTVFQWQSQNQTRQDSGRGQIFRNAEAQGKTIHLFVRPRAKEGNVSVPFHYCGVPKFLSWKGEKPITIQWELSEEVPAYLSERLKVPVRRS